MTKQITVEERRAISTKVLRPIPLQLTTVLDRQSGKSTPASTPSQTDTSRQNSRPQSARVPLKCGFELLSAVIKELLPTIMEHYAAVGLNGDPFDPDWDQLYYLERRGSLLMWVARTESNSIAGYAMAIHSKALFSKERRECFINSIWIDPAYREGLRGIKFIEKLVDAIKTLNGTDTIKIFSNDDYEPMKDGTSRVAMAYKRVGFRRVATMFEMVL